MTTFDLNDSDTEIVEIYRAIDLAITFDRSVSDGTASRTYNVDDLKASVEKVPELAEAREAVRQNPWNLQRNMELSASLVGSGKREIGAQWLDFAINQLLHRHMSETAAPHIELVHYFLNRAPTDKDVQLLQETREQDLMQARQSAILGAAYAYANGDNRGWIEANAAIRAIRSARADIEGDETIRGRLDPKLSKSTGFKNMDAYTQMELALPLLVGPEKNLEKALEIVCHAQTRAKIDSDPHGKGDEAPVRAVAALIEKIDHQIELEKDTQGKPEREQQPQAAPA